MDIWGEGSRFRWMTPNSEPRTSNHMWRFREVRNGWRKAESAVDVASRYGIVEVRAIATAGTATDFLREARTRLPFPIQALQIDGGSEWMATFEAACQDDRLPLWVLPHSPTLHGQVERLNRTHREEWWACYTDS